LELSPRAIVDLARNAGLDGIALTDHSCGANLPAFADACAEAKMPCLFGMEVSSSEEVHVLALFDDLARAIEFGNVVYDALPDVANDPERFGPQPIVTVDEEVVGFAEKLLIAGTSISFFDLVPMILDAGALCIPSHIDRPMCGAISHLGFLPDLPYDAVEVVESVSKDISSRWPVVQFSDSHYPDQIARRFTEVDVETLTVESLRAALKTVG
jgi:PHP family Zn ribbon phosphoesterase